eukprot:2657636-Amphidinium_carterae.3
MKNKLKLEIQGCSGYLSNGKTNVRLHYIGHHFYIKARVVYGSYRNVDYTEFVNWYNEWYDDFKHHPIIDDPNIPIYGNYILHNDEEQTNQTQRKGTKQKETSKPKTLQQPYKPSSPQKVAEHNLAHLPCRDWCEICVNGKSRQQYHKDWDNMDYTGTTECYPD